MNEKILIIDDDDSALFILESHLKKAGYKTETTNDGTEALERLKKNYYDLVIIDMFMPKLSGMELCQRLANKFPILMISADTSNEPRTKIIGKYDCFVEKSKIKENLVKSVKMAIDRWKLKREVTL